MELQEEKIQEINRYRGIIVNLYVDRARLPDGKECLREVVEHPGGVCVLPVDDRGRAYCVRQFRYPMREELLEAPAGKIEEGEDPLVCAARELGEETGFTAGELLFLGEYYPSPGYSTELLRLFLALDLRRGEAHPDAGEFLDLVEIPYEELLKKAEAGELRDGKTALAVLLARPRLAR